MIILPSILSLGPRAGACGRRELDAPLPWDKTVERVVIHVSDYLDFQGRPLPGGRQRHVLHLARVVREDFGREVVIVQKATKPFEVTDSNGIDVIGLKCDTSTRGDPKFGFMTRRLLRKGDGMIYAAGEDAWPFFASGAKGIQHGIWWDGPFSPGVVAIQRRRSIDLVRSVQSLLCVDTNFINWLRGQGAEGLELCKKCLYVPNYADIDRMDVGEAERSLGDPPRIIFARRYEPKRGISLLLDALAQLKRDDEPVRASIFTIKGLSKVRQEINERGLEDVAAADEESMDGILGRYRSADIAVVPTIWSEGTSLAAVEAICAGVPVIATPVGGLGNVVIPEFNGLLVEPTAKALALGIRRLCDENVWKQMRRNCLSLRDAFSRKRWGHQVHQWLKA